MIHRNTYRFADSTQVNELCMIVSLVLSLARSLFTPCDLVPSVSHSIFAVCDMTTLPPGGPLDEEWDEDGRHFSAAGMGDEGDENDVVPGAAQSRAEALNDTLRPLDR